MQTSKDMKSKAWSVLVGAIAINLTMGLNYSWSVIKKALVTDWHWTNVDASLPYMFYSAVYAFYAIFAGKLQDKFGPRLIASIGGLALGSGLIACVYSTDPMMLTISYGFVVSMGYSMCNAATLPASMKWFPPERRGLVAGTVMGAIGMAAVLLSLVINWTLANFGISKTFLLLAFGLVPIIFVSAQFLSNPPDEYEFPPTKTKHSPGLSPKFRSNDFDWHEMLKTTTFYKLWLMFFFAASAGLMIIGHLTTIAKTQADWDNGFYLVSLLALFNTAGRIVSGLISDKFGRVKTMKIVFFLQGVNLILFSSYLSPTLLAVGTMFIGLCYGACFTLFPLITADYYGIRNFGVNYSLVLTSWGCAGFFGPMMAGWVVDVYGSYSLAYIISAATLMASLVISFFIKQPVHSSDSQFEITAPPYM